MESESTGERLPAMCPHCREPLEPTSVRTAMWQGDRLAVVEDVPAHVCPSCLEQFYDDDVSDALRKLNEQGFPESDAREIIRVPVFSLEGRIRRRKELPEDVHID